MQNNDRVFIKGRNGAGKSTLVKTILSQYRGIKPEAKQFAGEIKLGAILGLGNMSRN